MIQDSTGTEFGSLLLGKQQQQPLPQPTASKSDLQTSVYLYIYGSLDITDVLLINFDLGVSPGPKMNIEQIRMLIS